MFIESSLIKASTMPPILNSDETLFDFAMLFDFSAAHLNPMELHRVRCTYL